MGSDQPSLCVSLRAAAAEYAELSVGEVLHSELFDLRSQLISLSDRVRSHDASVQ